MGQTWRAEAGAWVFYVDDLASDNVTLDITHRGNSIIAMRKISSVRAAKDLALSVTIEWLNQQMESLEGEL